MNIYGQVILKCFIDVNPGIFLILLLWIDVFQSDIVHLRSINWQCIFSLMVSVFFPLAVGLMFLANCWTYLVLVVGWSCMFFFLCGKIRGCIMMLQGIRILAKFCHLWLYISYESVGIRDKDCGICVLSVCYPFSILCFLCFISTL